jgi:UDP-N-acetylmuramoyl-tripeptide--D-alanyl-D-alanine ligase
VIALTLREIADLAGGSLGEGVDPGVVVGAPATIDSRSVAVGGLFCAIEGANADGHDFALAAIEAGAVAVLASRPVPAPHVVVEDVTVALGKLAAAVAARLPATVIGITGSAGKTSVKDLLAQILESAGPTVSPAGSHNNELGVPLTILQADETTRFLVVEMGARGIGHIRALCQLVRPKVGVVVNVGAAHVGEFGSLEETARAKAELIEALPADGTAVLNGDDLRVAAMAARTDARVLRWGTTGDVRLVGSVRGIDGTVVGLEHDGETHHIATGLIGDHVPANVAAAVTAALACSVAFADAATALAGVSPRSAHRMARHRRDDGVVVLDDTFNANPDAMAAALRTLATLAPAGRMAILGEMAEMGAASAQLHEGVGRLAAELGIEQLIVVGEAAAPMARGFEIGGGQAIVVGDVQAAVQAASARLPGTRLVLVKASRKVRLERVVDELLADHRASR